MRVKKVFVNDKRTRNIKWKGKEKRNGKREKETPYVRLRAVKSVPVFFFVPISTLDETKSSDRIVLQVAEHTDSLFHCPSCMVLHISDSLQQLVLLIVKIKDCLYAMIGSGMKISGVFTIPPVGCSVGGG